MLNEIVPELKSSKFSYDLKSAQVPSLKVLIRIDDEQTPGFYNFNELFDMASGDDFQHLGEIEGNTSPEGAANIQVTYYFPIKNNINSLLQGRLGLLKVLVYPI